MTIKEAIQEVRQAVDGLETTITICAKQSASGEGLIVCHNGHHESVVTVTVDINDEAKEEWQ